MALIPILQLLEGYLGVAATRHQLIVSNMANIDTPGYHTQDIDFRSELRKAADNNGGELIPAVHSVPGLLRRPDGNDVNLDREGLLLAETQMQYQIGVQIMKSEFHRLLSAINEGK